MPSTSSSSNSASSSPQCASSNTVKPLFNNNNQFKNVSNSCAESLQSTSSSISINSNHLTISNKTVCNKLANNLDGEEYEVYEKKNISF
jgi:hypothetical protein